MQAVGYEGPAYFKKGSYSGCALSSVHMARTLRAHGLGPRKSYTAIPAKVPLGLERHYWRGLVDGDGYVSLDAHGRYRVGLYGTQAIVEGFYNFCMAVAPGVINSRPRRHKGTLWSFSVGSKRGVQGLVRTLYTGPPVLSRKQERATAALEWAGA